MLFSFPSMPLASSLLGGTSQSAPSSVPLLPFFSPLFFSAINFIILRWAARVVRYWAIDLPDWEVLHFRDLDSGIWFREKVYLTPFFINLRPHNSGL